MKTTPVTPADLQRSVLAVPPLCRRADLALDEGETRKLVQHLRAGGVSTFMWGGNANLYNMGVGEFASFLDIAERLAGLDEWMIPSVGADFGKAADQLAILRKRAFPTAMALPLRFPSTPAGVARGLGLLAEKYGRPLIAYVKDDGYADAADLAALVRDGSLCAIKYGTVRKDPTQDPALAELLRRVDPALVISGIGERPVIDHFGFGLRAFTSGCVSIAPRLSTAIRVALQRGDKPTAARLRALFLPLEDLRDAHSALRVLHAAVKLAGIAETGPMDPFLSAIDDPGQLAAIRAAAQALRAENDRAPVASAAQ